MRLRLEVRIPHLGLKRGTRTAGNEHNNDGNSDSSNQVLTLSEYRQKVFHEPLPNELGNTFLNVMVHRTSFMVVNSGKDIIFVIFE
jgi:hypothetical protein